MNLAIFKRQVNFYLYYIKFPITILKPKSSVEIELTAIASMPWLWEGVCSLLAETMKCPCKRSMESFTQKKKSWTRSVSYKYNVDFF